MTPKPIPDNLHPSQCYRLLDHERDTLQEGDEMLCFRIGQSQWEPIDKTKFGDTPSRNRTYRRPFTPPTPVQVQEFWRLLEVGKDTLQAGDQVLFRLGHDGWKWEPVHESRIGCVPRVNHTYRRRVTVPVAAPAPVADGGPVESLKSFADQEALRIVKAFVEESKAKFHGEYRQRLFEYLDQTCGHAPTESGPFLVSVDGQEAPDHEHATLEDARNEAERLARRECPAQVRLLRQVAVAKAEVTVKWEGQNI